MCVTPVSAAAEAAHCRRCLPYRSAVAAKSDVQLMVYNLPRYELSGGTAAVHTHKSLWVERYPRPRHRTTPFEPCGCLLRFVSGSGERDIYMKYVNRYSIYSDGIIGVCRRVRWKMEDGRLPQCRGRKKIKIQRIHLNLTTDEWIRCWEQTPQRISTNHEPGEELLSTGGRLQISRPLHPLRFRRVMNTTVPIIERQFHNTKSLPVIVTNQNDITLPPLSYHNTTPSPVTKTTPRDYY